MKKKERIIIGSIVTIAVIVIGLLFLFTDLFESNEISESYFSTPNIEFEMDKLNRTLTVVSIEYNESEYEQLYWSDVELDTSGEGSVTFPTGTIDIGDIITNCREIIGFKWKPTNEFLSGMGWIFN